MRLFSEKVSPTFTSSNLNIITVEEFAEVFFDVYELEINNKKYIAEKVSEYKGNPVVEIPVVVEGEKGLVQFVLQKGNFEVLFNKDSLVNTIPFTEEVESTNFTETIAEEVQEDPVYEIITQKKESILEDVKAAKQAARSYFRELEEIQKQNIEEFLLEKQDAIEVDIKKSRETLLAEFIKLAENVREGIFESNEEERLKLTQYINSNINRLTESIDEKVENVEQVLSEKVESVASTIISTIVLEALHKEAEKTSKGIDTRFKSISENLSTLFTQEREKLANEIKTSLTEAFAKYDDAIITLEKANIEINDSINKAANKSLSRIGNTKTQLEESIKNTAIALRDEIDKTKEKVQEYYEERISIVENNLNTISDDSKKLIVEMVDKSRESLIQYINEVKSNVPSVVIEKSSKNQNVDLKGVKDELEKLIGTKFNTEIAALKRLIELSSGGGSVAAQFADGGVMNGDLTVNGHIYVNNGGSCGPQEVATQNFAIAMAVALA